MFRNLLYALLLVSMGLAVSEDTFPLLIGKAGDKNLYISPERNTENAVPCHNNSWADALTYCQRVGKVIASVETKQEMTLVSTFFKKEAQAGRVYNTWTAGTDYFTEGKWYWITSRKPVDFSVSVQTNPPPVSENPYYNCLYIGPGGYFQSTYCTISYARAICQ